MRTLARLLDVPRSASFNWGEWPKSGTPIKSNVSLHDGLYGVLGTVVTSLGVAGVIARHDEPCDYS